MVVTANYRLDILGYMHMPQMQAGAPATGNFALLDNLQALRFVQRNIAGFGGDPGNVTLMGQSAGPPMCWRCWRPIRRAACSTG